MGKKLAKRSLTFVLVLVMALAAIFAISAAPAYSDEQTTTSQGMDERPDSELDSGNGGNAGSDSDDSDDSDEQMTTGQGMDERPGSELDSGNGGDAGPITLEAGNVMLISTPEGLFSLAETLNNGLFTETFDIDVSEARVLLTNDIDTRDFRQGLDFLPIGTLEYPFTGEFDGGGYTVSNLYVNGNDEMFQGLFGVVGNGGSVHDVTLTGVNITGRAFIGGIAGHVDFGEVRNCTVEGNITADVYVAGGIAGAVTGGVIDSCQTSGTVTADVENAGGIAGLAFLDNSVISNCTSSSLITVTFSAGGIVGCLTGGDVEGCSFVGEIVCESNLFGNITGEIDTVEADEVAVDVMLEALATDDALWQPNTRPSYGSEYIDEPAGNMEVNANE